MIHEWPLVGRSEELAMIAQATRAVGDRARGIVLAGAAGVGKTRLAREAVARCGRQDARRRWIVGTTSARGVPLGAFADITSSFGPDPLRRVREVIAGLVGEHPHHTVVGVDDAHLLDDLSAFAVHQLVMRRLATVILTIRSGEDPPDAITAVWKDEHLDRLELQTLSLNETTELLEQVLDGPVQSHSARRLWQFTQGNVLYLRHLVESEVGAGRMAEHAGVWLWEGDPILSPTLAELVEARIARVPESVRNVLDALAVTEPLEAPVLAAVTSPDALAAAESLDLVRADTRARPVAIRLAHPMFGEVRRAGSLRLRRLRGRIASELAHRTTTDPRDLVRRALLTIDSDLAPDPDLYLSASSAAMQLMDVRLAESLAQRAVAAGGGVDAKSAHAMANFWLERPIQAETILAELADQTSGPARAQVAIQRALNFATELGRPTSAERELNDMRSTDGEAEQPITAALRSLIDLVRGRPSAAVEEARAVLANPHAGDLAQMLSIWAVVTGLGDIGRVDDVESAVDRGYRLAERSAEVSHARFQLAFLQAYAYRLAGMLAASDAAIARIRRDTFDVPFEEAWQSLLVAVSAMSRGALADAQRLLRETLAYLGTGDSGRMVKGFGQTWLAMVTAVAGQAADARREFAAIQWWAQEPNACVFDPERSFAEAWVYAAEGATSQAISVVCNAAQLERRRGRHAWEVCLLQTATQFGNHATATRLAELAEAVQGPRASAAAAHAAALAAGNGDALLEASHRYEEFGDRIAAADAAAQAIVAYQNAGLKGAVLTASATASRLADACQGAQTPALRVVATPLPFTSRQREIISLAAQGLSNKQIADRLTVSVRSVEGHFFRASQTVGATSRDQLIAILLGR